MVARLPETALETPLLRIRHEILYHDLDLDQAVAALRLARSSVPDTCPFAFDGVANRERIDSYYDPFGNLDIRQRTLLEIGRELYRGGSRVAAEEVRRELLTDNGLNALQRLQLDAYWRHYLSSRTAPTRS